MTWKIFCQKEQKYGEKYEDISSTWNQREYIIWQKNERKHELYLLVVDFYRQDHLPLVSSYTLSRDLQRRSYL